MAVTMPDSAMANPSLRLESNEPGLFYVDQECIDCDMCRMIAPGTFDRDDHVGLSRVYRQPASEQELAAAQDALESCPADAIGRDGALATVSEG